MALTVVIKVYKSHIDGYTNHGVKLFVVCFFFRKNCNNVERKMSTQHWQPIYFKFNLIPLMMWDC